MFLEQVDSAAMQRHRRRVGKLDAVRSRTSRGSRASPPACDCPSRARRPPARCSLPDSSQHARAQRRRASRCRSALSVYAGPPSDPSGGTGLPSISWSIFAVPILPWSAARSDRELEIGGAQAVQHLDDSVAADVRRVAQRRAPVAVLADERILVDQIRIARHEVAHDVDVVVPDRVDELNGLHESRPARRLVAARENELRVGELGGRRLDVDRGGTLSTPRSRRGRRREWRGGDPWPGA